MRETYPTPPPDPWAPQPAYWPPQPPPRRGIPGWVVGAIVIGLAVLIAGALALAVAAQRAITTTGTATWGTGRAGGTTPAAPASPSQGGDPSGTDSSDIAAKVDPAVVDVNTVLGYQNARAAGTGMVLTSSGLVLTNNHVIAGATSISVTDVGNGRTYDASVVGYDRSDDIALIQLKDASGLATVAIGDSSTVRVGDAVVAIGNAGGAGGTPAVAPGTVTALNRSITASDPSAGTSERLTGLIEVGADIVSGDSGGPLVNSSGQVIGIDTAASAGFQYQDSGEGYAIPINAAMSIARQIEAGQGSSTVHIGATAFLGVQTRAGGRGQSATGAAVAGVLSGSPAAAAGLGQGDVIQYVDGYPIDSATTLTTLLDRHHPGDRVKVAWMDPAGRTHSATVTLATGPVG
jgi:S1-C subfamily serine protease